ncbi:MAG: MFS transporter [Deltaproteobacteria bacterium]|nr:MFS transporter [Deltaproteobacteria bacterium]
MKGSLMSFPIHAPSSRRNIWLLFQGHFVSKVGTAVFDIAIVLWMTQHAAAAGVVGLVMMLSKLPEILLGPLAGSIVDMGSRKKVLVLTDLIVGLMVMGLGLIFLVFSERTSLQFALIVLGAVGIGIGDSFFNPAVSSFIPELVTQDRLRPVNSLYRFLTTAATFLGQGLAGLLFAKLGAPLLFLLNGVSYLFSSGSEAGIASPRSQAVPNEGLKSTLKSVLMNLREGLVYIRAYEELRNFLLIICLYHFFVSPFTVILPFYVTDVLRVSPDWYGYLMASFGAGLMIGFILAGSLKPSGAGQSALVIGCLGLSALGYLGIGLFPHPVLTLIFILIIGTAIALIVVTLNTIMQIATPNAMHGRIFGLYHTLSSASIPVGMGFFGLGLDLLRKVLSSLSLNEAHGPAIIFQLCGIALSLIVLAMIRKPSFRRFLTIQAAQV